MKTYYLKFSGLLFILLLSISVFSQVLITDDGAINSPDNSAMLEIKSNSKGMLIPRLTTSQRNTLTATAVSGLLIFDSDLGSFFIYGKTAKGTDGWVDLSSGGTIWEKSGNNIYLANSNYNVGIGTKTPSKKFVLQATNDKDTLFEILDKDGKPLMLITPTLSKFYFNQSTKKGVAGGFAVGRYAGAKADLDTALFLVTPDSTRVYTSGVATKGVAGGFAVGRYAGAKGEVLKYFYTGLDSTRVYTDGSGTKGVAGGFAVGRYAPAKGEETQYFNTNINNTRVYTDGGGAKGVAGGFAVGRYAGAKGTSNNYMYMIPDNYFIGHQSGDSLQNSNYTGKYNTFFGYKAGLKDTIGGSNVFIGYKSGMNTTGLRITSPSIDTLGSRNVFLGYEAGLGNTVGADNVFLGYQAGLNNTEGENNILLGANAGENNETGENNIFIGKSAGRSNVTGLKNIYIGFEAGKNATGNGNVMIGEGVGYNVTTGGANTLYGQLAGASLTTGSQNVFIGPNSGNSITDGNGNVCIGYKAGINETGSNKLYISNWGTTTTLIYGEFSPSDNNGYVQINKRLNIAGEFTFPSVDGTINQVMKTDGAGSLSWVDVNSIVNGDNLGNHSATLDLDMNNYSIVDVNDITINNGNSVGLGASLERIYFDGTNDEIEILGAEVGIGTSSPAYNLDIYENLYTTNPMFRLNQYNTNGDASAIFSTNGGNSYTIGIDASDGDKFKISDYSYLGVYDRFVINSNGDIGVGTSTPDYPFEVEKSNAGSSVGDNKFISMFKNTGGVYSDGIKVQAGGNDAATTGDVIYMYCADGDGDWVGSIYSTNGTLAMNGKSASYSKSYDVKDTKNGLNIISKLKVVDYDFSSKDNICKTGFIGEEVLEIFPTMVNYDKNANEYGVANSFLVPILTKGMQEQQVQIESLKKEIENLNLKISRIEELEIIINTLKKELNK